MNDTLMNVSNFQRLVAGDRNMFIFLKNTDDTSCVPAKDVLEFVIQTNKVGYAFDNVYELLSFCASDFERFKSEFARTMAGSVKKGLILRKSFGESFELTDYTSEDWMAVFAQYSITYGWTHEYSVLFDSDPVKVLDEYVGSMSDVVTDLTASVEKVMKIGFEKDAVTLLMNIMQSPVVLRNQQIKTLESAPKRMLITAAKISDITIKETLVKVMTLLSGVKLDFPILKTSTDVLRFVVSAYARNPVEGQLRAADLKDVRIKVPTSIRKILLNNLEQIANKHGNNAKYLTEDMFSYDMFWKRLDKYLRYESAVKTRQKYPNYTKAIDLLYENDRSWTFNGRFSAAKAALDYAKAVEVAAERPGFLLRNLKDFLRMTVGTHLPVKRNSVHKSNALYGALSNKDDKVIKTDAKEFFNSDRFVAVLERNLNLKLAWQLIEELKNDSIFKEVSERIVQGNTIYYSVPLPACNKKLTKTVVNKISTVVSNKLKERNKDIKLYIDNDSKKYRLQYSGRNSKEISYSGEFLSPGSELSIGELIKTKGIKDPLIRLGVMWRSRKKGFSCDIDHNVSLLYTDDFNEARNVYYGFPTFKVKSKVLATSSGDITFCGGPDSKFSTELVDLDIGELKKAGITKLFNSLTMFSYGLTIGEFETYLFFSVIDKKDRLVKSHVTMDLAKADYAIAIDPDNVEKADTYLGVEFDLKKDNISILCIPLEHQTYTFRNISNAIPFIKKALNNHNKHLTINYVLNKAVYKDNVVKNVNKANLVISRKSREDLGLAENVVLLHPGREMEKINELIF